MYLLYIRCMIKNCFWSGRDTMDIVALALWDNMLRGVFFFFLPTRYMDASVRKLILDASFSVTNA